MSDIHVYVHSPIFICWWAAVTITYLSVVPSPSHAFLSPHCQSTRSASASASAVASASDSALSPFQSTWTKTALYLSNDPNNNSNNNHDNDKDSVDNDTTMLNQRIHKIRAQMLSEQLSLPPNPNLSPTQFVTAILRELRRDDQDHFYPMAGSGIRTLVRSSSDYWRDQMRQSVGCPIDTIEEFQGDGETTRGRSVTGTGEVEDKAAEIKITEDALVEALERAMSRPNNQYRILVQDQNLYDDNDNDDNDFDDDNVNVNDASASASKPSSYALYFPGDIVDYHDGKCWLEAQLRDPISNELLVTTGWSLVRSNNDNSNSVSVSNGNGNKIGNGNGKGNGGEWLLDRLDWQDFRDEFRPGIGREEWMRICG